VVVKLSRQTDTVTREEAALRHLSTVVPGRVPRLYLSGYLRGTAFMAMEAVEGEIISGREFESQFPEVLAALLELQEAVRKSPSDERALQREMLQTVGELETCGAVSELGMSELCSRLTEQIHGLTGLGLPAVPQHGDFSLGNVLTRGKGGIVVIDWEDYASVRLPGYDLVALFATLPGRDFLADRRLGRLLSDGLRQYAVRLKVDERWLPTLVPLHLARLFLSCERTGRRDPAQAALSHLSALARRSHKVGELIG